MSLWIHNYDYNNKRALSLRPNDTYVFFISRIDVGFHKPQREPASNMQITDKFHL